MSVSKRKTSAGETREYHYAFMQSGKRFFGVCEGCKTKAEAEAYEIKLKKIAKEASAQKTQVAIIENFRKELTGGEDILLSDAFEMAMKKPRRREASKKRTAFKQTIFNDFVAFMDAKYPDVQTLSAVLPKHAEEYISMIRTSGRFEKNIVYQRKGKSMTVRSPEILSNRTANEYLTVCREIFSLLARDAGLMNNPFDMPKLESSEEERQTFSEEEIVLIRDNLDEFTRPLFSIAIATALREGDICTLRWSDIDFHENVIRRKMNKTGRLVEIPFSDDLRGYLLQQKNENNSEYVFPDHASMYQRNPSGVSYRIKMFLEKLGIRTTVVPKGRSRAVSIKDLHSCRHTFCYYAGLRGIPLSVVQGILGHMSSEMTKRYNAHATLETKRRNMQLMADFLGLAEGRTDEDMERDELKKLVDTMPIQTVRKILADYQK